MSLSALTVRKAAPRDKPFKISDGGGLFILINPNGSKLWRLSYRFAGKQKTLALGSYPQVSLSDARSLRDKHKETLSEGTDPAFVQKQQKFQQLADSANTFKSVVDDYLLRQQKRNLAEGTYERKERLLNTNAKELHQRPIREIKPIEILNILQKVERQGRVSTAYRLKSEISAVFRHAVSTLRADSDPTHILRGALEAHEQEHYAAITDLAQFRELMVSVYEYDGWPTLTAALKLTALTAVRPGVTRKARKCDFDLEGSKWTVPLAHIKMRRQKNRKPFEVALSCQAVTVVQEMIDLNTESNLLFPSIRNNQRQLSENAFNSALRRMGYTSNDHVAHGFRSSFSTIMNEHRFDAELIEATLDHQESGVRRIYNRANYWELRLELMQQWADLISPEKKPKDYSHLL